MNAICLLLLARGREDQVQPWQVEPDSFLILVPAPVLKVV